MISGKLKLKMSIFSHFFNQVTYLIVEVLYVARRPPDGCVPKIYCFVKKNVNRHTKRSVALPSPSKRQLFGIRSAALVIKYLFCVNEMVVFVWKRDLWPLKERR